MHSVAVPTERFNHRTIPQQKPLLPDILSIAVWSPAASDEANFPSTSMMACVRVARNLSLGLTSTTSMHFNWSIYVRINYATPPETVVRLLLHEWRLRVPSLIISVLGRLANVPLQAKLSSVAKQGLLKTAKTTEA
ncbi:Transient receptor potential cation channel trpm [Taenia solium]|eukprot:TsM_000628200 transcript=TsM_000628200 gene=TsM_000628200